MFLCGVEDMFGYLYVKYEGMSLQQGGGSVNPL